MRYPKMCIETGPLKGSFSFLKPVECYQQVDVQKWVQYLCGVYCRSQC